MPAMFALTVASMSLVQGSPLQPMKCVTRVRSIIMDGGSHSIVRSWSADVPTSRVVPNILDALQADDAESMRTFWDWTHELYRGRPVNGHGDFDVFASRAVNSEIGALLGCEGYTLEPLNLVGDGEKYATQVAHVCPKGDLDGQNARRFLFQLRRELRPPYLGSWSVWGVIVSDARGDIQDLSGGF